MNSIFIRTLLWNDPSDLCMLLYLYNAYVSRYEDRLRRMFDLRHKPDDLGIFLFFFQISKPSNLLFDGITRVSVFNFVTNNNKSIEKFIRYNERFKKHPVYNSV